MTGSATTTPQTAPTRRHRRIRRLVQLIVAGAVAAAITTTATPVHAAAKWQYWELDNDAWSDAATIDRDGNGNSEEVWFDADNDRRWDAHVWNTAGNDDLLENASIDANEDGSPDLLLVDTDQRIGFDVYYRDGDGDGQWDTTQPVPAVQGGDSMFEDFGVFEIHTGGSVEPCPGRVVCMRPGL